MLPTQKTKLTFIAFYLGFLSFAFSQSTPSSSAPDEPIRTCSTKELHEIKMATDPAYEKHFLEKQKRMKELMDMNPTGERVLCENPVKLPMAVHFQGISNPNAACLIGLAEIQIQILNDDYQGLNTDISIWNNSAAAYFPGVSNGETCIEFCLATQNHPAGYGLVSGDPAVTINAFTGDFNADWSGYINIFVRNIGPLGYSPLGGDGDGDGVTIDVQAFGSGPGCGTVVPGAPYNLGRTLTHELGHYMNLDHIWGSSGCGGGDGVADTPNSDVEYYGCPALGVQSCGSNDMHMNYMDYTNDACMYMFSAGQSTVMENYTASGLGLVTANTNACTAPEPRIQFVNASTTILEGTSNCNTGGTKEVTLTLSIDIAPSADAEVTFIMGGSASGSVDYSVSPAIVVFPAGQTADQTVTVTIYEDAEVEPNEVLDLSYTIEANGGDAIPGDTNQTHSLNINNDDNAPATSAIVTLVDQDFNSGLSGWTINDGGSSTDTWALSTNNSGLDGSQYLRADSDAAGNGVSMDEELISPVFDGTSVTGLTLEFDQYINIYAGSGDFNETFDVDIWDGTTWQNVFNWTEADGDIGNWNAPDQQSIDISAHANTNNQLRFTYVAQYDWWWAIDNITVTGIGSTEVQMAANSSSGAVDYNFGPMTTIHFYDEVTGNIMMTLVNNSNHDYGCTHVEIDNGANTPPGATASNAPESEFVTDKTFRVIPEFNNPSGNYTISLYYTDEEITGWAAESGSPASDLGMVKSTGDIYAATFFEMSPTTVTAFGSDHIYTATFNTGFSGFALGGAPNPLPVELVDLNASPQGNSILVEWTTASETNNKGFELLRKSANQNDFERIAWLDGRGTTSITNTYRYDDHQVTPGVLYYYQLKQIDFDGAYSLSKMLAAEIVGKNIQVTVYPNPVRDVLRLNIDSPLSGTYSIVHANGQLVEQASFDAGAQELALNMKGYARGVYWIVIQTEQERIIKKVVLGKL